MAKLTGPLLSFGARGQIGSTLVTSDWKGVKYARQYVVPANPRTAEQTLTRDVFSMLNQLWLASPTIMRAPFAANALGKKYTDRNKLMAENIPALRGQTDMLNFIASPGALGGPPLDSLAASTGSGSGEIDAVAVPPTAPTDWTLVGVDFIGILDQDPADPFAGIFASATDLATPFDPTLTGFGSGATGIVCAWPVWTRPDGRTAYGPSLLDSATAGV